MFEVNFLAFCSNVLHTLCAGIKEAWSNQQIIAILISIIISLELYTNKLDTTLLKAKKELDVICSFCYIRYLYLYKDGVPETMTSAYPYGYTALKWMTN